MIFDSDMVIGIIILIIGAIFFTATMGEYLSIQKDSVVTNILHDKATSQLKSLICDGTIEACILLINNNKGNIAENIIKNRIQNAKIEINSIDKYDYFIVNDNFEVAANELINIALSSQKKARLFDKGKIIKSWLE